MARQFFIIFGCLALGELLIWITGIRFPSSIIGMLLLTFFLRTGWVKMSWVKHLSQFLISNLGFFFVPPGIAILLYLDVIKAHLLPVILATVISTVLVLVVTGHTHQLVIKSERRLARHGKTHKKDKE